MLTEKKSLNTFHFHMVEKKMKWRYNNNMPKLYEYFGLIILFYSNDHHPIHVHGKFQGRESKAEFIIVNGQIVDIIFRPVVGKMPLTETELKKFKEVVKYFKEDIIKKWIDFFVMNKEVKAEIITKRLK